MRQALDQHRAALDGYLAAARGVAPERWHEPPAPGKWTPAQITDHLIRTYCAMTGELRGTGGLQIRTGRVKRALLRGAVLPWILRRNRIPRGAPAPRELVPGEGDLQEAALAELLRHGDEFEAAIGAVPTATVTHPYFGTLDAVTATRFCAIHIDHHCKQL